MRENGRPGLASASKTEAGGESQCLTFGTETGRGHMLTLEPSPCMIFQAEKTRLKGGFSFFDSLRLNDDGSQTIQPSQQVQAVPRMVVLVQALQVQVLQALLLLQ